MQFVKMHGIGNDFIIFNGFSQVIDSPETLAKRLCDRHFGVGADGLLIALRSKVADARMRIINADGGEPEMCGNGIRCMGKYLYDTGLVKKTTMTIETLAGVLTLKLDAAGGRVRAVTVDMGVPVFEPEKIPVDAPSNQFFMTLGDRRVEFFCVSMGNPHAVTYDIYPEDERFAKYGAAMERNLRFPKGTNVEFCRLNRDGGVDVRVWERGDGETLACGTGACAVVAAGATLGLLGRETTVHLPGGDLNIRWAEDGHIFMTGPAERVFAGEV